MQKLAVLAVVVAIAFSSLALWPNSNVNSTTQAAQISESEQVTPTSNDNFLRIKGDVFALKATPLTSNLMAATTTESASIKIRRLTDNKVIASRNGNGAAGAYYPPDDRARRGEPIRIEINYSTNGTIVDVFGNVTPFGGFFAYRFDNVVSIADLQAHIWGKYLPKATINQTGFSSNIYYSWDTSVPTSLSADNIYYYVEGKHTGSMLTYIRLPIGNH